MLKKKIACAVAVMFVLGAGLGGCKKKKEEPASPTDVATQTDMTTTVETTAETTVETEIVEETNEKGEKRTVVKTKASNSAGGQGNNNSGNSGGGQKAAPVTTKAPAPTTTAKPARTWSYQSGLSASIESAINNYRQQNGLPALAVKGNLQSKSKTQAESNASRQHTGHGGLQISYGGGKGSSSAIVAGWKASPGHNANMLDEDISSIGAAAYKDSNGIFYVVVSFGF